jgi:hypothetical protein
MKRLDENWISFINKHKSAKVFYKIYLGLEWKIGRFRVHFIKNVKILMCQIFGHSKMNYFQGIDLHCSRCHGFIMSFDDERVRGLLAIMVKDIQEAHKHPRRWLLGKSRKDNVL